MFKYYRALLIRNGLGGIVCGVDMRVAFWSVYAALYRLVNCCTFCVVFSGWPTITSDIVYIAVWLAEYNSLKDWDFLQRSNMIFFIYSMLEKQPREFALPIWIINDLMTHSLTVTNYFSKFSSTGMTDPVKTRFDALLDLDVTLSWSTFLVGLAKKLSFALL